MLLIAKHDRVVEIENNPAIRALEQAELEFVEPNCLEKNNHVMPARLLQDSEPFRQTGSTRRNDCRLDPERTIVIETIPQTQTRAGRVTMFADAQNSQRFLSYNVWVCPCSGSHRALRLPALLLPIIATCY